MPFHMSFFEAIILGIVEGVTEFLPISSTAHLMMASQILNITQNEFVKSFEIVIQLGAVAAIVFMFSGRLIKHPSLWKKVAIAFAPTAIIGFLLYKLIKTYLIGNLALALWSLVIGGVALIIAEIIFAKKFSKETDAKPSAHDLVPHLTNDQSTSLANVRISGADVENITNKQAFYIGIIQSLAVIPGVSRSAATIVPALFFGASRKAAAEFSFLLAIPTVAAAAGYDLIKNIDILTVNGNAHLLAVGFIVSFITAILSIKLMLAYIQNHSFISFGIYRIIIAIAFFTFFIAR